MAKTEAPAYSGESGPIYSAIGGRSAPECAAPHQIFDPDRAYRINDFARDPNHPESAKIPKAKSTIWKAVKDGTFPPPTKLSARTPVWFGRSLNSWLEEKYHQSGNAV